MNAKLHISHQSEENFLPTQTLVFKANWSYFFKACFLPMEAALEDTGGGAGTYGGGDGDLSAVVDDVGFGGKLGVEVLVAAVDIGDESMPLLDAEDSLNVLLIPMLPKLESLMTWLTGATLQGKSKILNRGNTRSGTSCF